MLTRYYFLGALLIFLFSVNPLNVNCQVTGGTIEAGSNIISYNTSPGSFRETVPATGCQLSLPTYTWEQSNDGINFQAVSTFYNHYTSTSFVPDQLQQSTYFRRRINCLGGSGYSNTVLVKVVALSPGIIYANWLQVPMNNSPGFLTATPASYEGAAENFDYQWQSSTDNITYSDIVGQIAAQFTPGNLQQSMYFRRKAKGRTSLEEGNTNVCFVQVYTTSPTTPGYVKERLYSKPGIATKNDALAETAFRYTTETINYTDGFGRNIQSVMKQASLSTGTTSPTDVVVTNIYDEFGKASVSAMPYVSNQSDGSFRIQSGKEFQEYNTTKFPGENYYFGQTEYEKSPLKKTLSVAAQGNSWIGSNVKAKMQTWTNTDDDAVRIWNVTNNQIGEFGTYVTSETYSNGQLRKDIVIDEAGKQTVTFTNSVGKIVLEKVQLTATADDGTGRNYDGWLCTYYLYDDLGNLRCIIQPEGVKALVNANWQLSTKILSGQCFRYEYDYRNRLIMKKVPGAGDVYMVYDKRDRLVMMQDANLRGQGNWVVTLYENNFNRPIKTGLLSNSYNNNSFSQHMSAAKESVTYPFPTEPTTGDWKLLTRVNYDDYSELPSGLSPNLASYTTTGFFSNYNVAPEYAQKIEKTEKTNGLVTWTQNRILGSNPVKYIDVLNIFDDKGNVIQTQNLNELTGDLVVTTNQYSWNGQLLRSLQNLVKKGTGAQTIETLTTYNYDELNRVVSVNKRINNVGGISVEATIAKNEYDEFGKVRRKTVAPSFNNNAGLESLSYDYNVRGWLLGVNRDYAKNPGSTTNYFGYDLGYDKKDIKNGATTFATYTASQLNGNIAGMLWKTKGSGEIRKYDFAYDAVNQLTEADFNQFTGSSFNKDAKVDYSINNLSYDYNGNIKTMNQMGLQGSQSKPIDQLAYTYLDGSNKLSKVIDETNDPNSPLGDFKYASKTSTDFDEDGNAVDYVYDGNGNLTKDNNKKISLISYNYLNLPQTINTSKGTIEYLYDAKGEKLQKTVTETGQPVKITKYIGGAVYQDDVLQFMGHEEGRIRYTVANGNGAEKFSFDYFIKDHLGNVRMVLTDEIQQDDYFAASFESASQASEQQYYDRVNVGLTSRPLSFGNDNDNGSQVQLLQKSTQSIGAGRLMKVMSGDKFNIRVDYFIPTAATDNSSASGLTSVVNTIANLIDNGAASAALKGSGSLVGANLRSTTAFTDQLSQEEGVAGSPYPKAYLHILFFDEQFNYVSQNSEVIQTTSVGITQPITKPQREAVKNGYLYVYISNESNNFVYFDNLQVTHSRGQILQETHYYPFGLTMSQISSKAIGKLENKYKFNEGTELNDDLEIDLYETPFRGYDPQIGKFQQVDALAEKYNSSSPYQFAFNNPIAFNDPIGMEPNGSGGPHYDWDRHCYVDENGVAVSFEYATFDLKFQLGDDYSYKINVEKLGNPSFSQLYSSFSNVKNSAGIVASYFQLTWGKQASNVSGSAVNGGYSLSYTASSSGNYYSGLFGYYVSDGFWGDIGQGFNFGGANASDPWPLALSVSGTLIADDVTVIGIADDEVIPVILAAAATYDITQRTYVTYTLTGPAGQTYVGRTSGFGDPYSIMMSRYGGHHMQLQGYGLPKLDQAVQGLQGYPAIRGREQQLIDFYGGVGNPSVGNSIRGVSKYNPMGRIYHGAASLYFGELSPYTGF